MRKFLLVFFVVLFSSRAYPADYYWINGGGEWSDLNHWRLGSTSGSIPSIIPSPADNIFFTNNSGFGTTIAERTVVLDANGFCNNMSWATDVPNSPVFNRSSSSYKLEVWGNLALAPTVNYQQSIVFKGGAISSFTTNGTVDGIFAFEIDKPGGTLNLVDSFVCPSSNAANNILLTAGTFNIAGKTIKARQFNSNNDGVRSLDMTNAYISVPYRWDYRGSNKALSSDNSFIYTGVYLFSDSGAYDVVECNGDDYNNFGINNTTFSKLTFTRVNEGSYAQVNDNNTIDTLIFRGGGRIFNNNTIGRIEYESLGRIRGGDNIIGTVHAQGYFVTEVDDTNTVDSLLLAPNHTTQLMGTLYINEYLSAQGLPCEAFTELFADTSSFEMHFAPGATTFIDNVMLTGITAYGDVTPISVVGIDGGANTGFNITPPASISGTTLYWIGGAGDWNDNAHWSYTSGGPGGACIPFMYDTVVFDTGSGLAAGDVVTTSGNAYCHNISWLPGVGTSTFSESDYRFSIYGSAVLNPAITMNAGLEFLGEDTASTITFNGSTLGTLNVIVNKTDEGALTVTDDWSNANGSFTLTDGRLNMSERVIDIRSFSSSSTYATKHLDITDAAIHVSYSWTYTGIYKYMEAEGSHIVSDYNFTANGLSYPSVELTYTGGTSTTFSISSTTFGDLTFTSPSPTSVAGIGSNNTIQRLEFTGAGSVSGNNNIDTLLLAASRNYYFAGMNTINEYILAESPACGGLMEIRGNPSATLAFSGSAVIDMDNIYLQNMAVTGVPPVTLAGADAGGNSGWDISSAPGNPHYWIGGAGDWNDAGHWSNTSGGTGGACIPTVYDDVYFDENSGFASGSTMVTVSEGNAYCKNLDWSGAINSPVWNKAAPWTIEVWGDSVLLNSTATFTVSPLTLKGNMNTVIGGSALGNFDIRIHKPGGSLTFLNDYNNNQTDILVNAGTLNLSGLTLSVSSINNEGVNDSMNMDITDAIITTGILWKYDGNPAAHTLSADNSVITTATFNALGLEYDNVNVSGILNTSAVLGSTTIDKLIFTNPNTASQIGVNGTNNTIGTLDYKGGGGVYGTGNIIDTLIFFPGNTYRFNSGTNTTITGAWYGSGTPCRLTEIISSSLSSNATITKDEGDVEFDYVRLRRITATGTSTAFTAREHSVDLSGNVGWTIAPYDGAAPIEGLGADTAILESDFPYTLHTDGFFGSPLSEYIWNDLSTLDSLVITDTGTYSVEVNFVDGCTITDTVNITYADVLPVIITRFEVTLASCTPQLEWTIGSARNFAVFEVERSMDGRSFTKVGEVAYNATQVDYHFIDNYVSGSGSYFYRLKLKDYGNDVAYTNIVTVNIDCHGEGVKVFPNVTNSLVNVLLPDVDRSVSVEVYDNSGKTMAPEITGQSQGFQVDLTPYPAGNYYIKITEHNRQHTFKVIRH